MTQKRGKAKSTNSVRIVVVVASEMSDPINDPCHCLKRGKGAVPKPKENLKLSYRVSYRVSYRGRYKQY